MWTQFPRRSRVPEAAAPAAPGKSERSSGSTEEALGLCDPESILQARVVPSMSVEPRGIQMDKNLSTKLTSPLETTMVLGGLGFLRTSRSSFPCRGARVGLRAPAIPSLDLSASKSPRPQGRLRGAMGRSSFESPRAWA